MDLKIRNLRKDYGAFPALNGVSLDIRSGELIALLGPSGSGKTTLLRSIAGLEVPDAGQILFGDVDASSRSVQERNVGFVFQHYALFRHMKVFDNIAFGLRVRNRSRRPADADIRKKVLELLDLVQLNGLEGRYPAQLSGGQRQRVALARSLAKKPKVLLLDEPLGALDKKLREETQFELMDLQMELGLTFLIVTHDQDEAMTVSDRIAVMNHGKLVQVATPGDMYEQPNSRYVADFIGNINLFEGAVESVSPGETKVRGADPAGSFVAAGDQAPAVGAAVTLAVRPEKMRISIEPPPPDAVNVLTGEVWDLAYMGDWTVVLVKIDGSETIVRVSRANMTRTEEKPIGWDDRVHVWFAPDSGILLTS